MLGEASPFRPGDLAALAPDRRAMLALVEERVVAAIADSGGSPGGYGVIHNDFILQNCLHHEGRTAVIDFDDCGRGFHLTDLGAMLGNLADYEDDGLRAAFLEGYARVRSIPAGWEDQFELMVALRHAVTVLWLLGLRHTGRASAGFVERNLEHRFAAIAHTLGR